MYQVGGLSDRPHIARRKNLLMAKKSKKYLEAAKQVESNKEYSLDEAVSLVKKIDFANFDASVEAAFKLNVDTKQADQQLRGAVVLPNGTGKDQTVVVFAKGPKAQEAKDAGADVVGDDDLVARIQDGWLDFDVAIATPDMMAQVGRLGRVLGPKGLMPNPKTGTVTMDVNKAVTESKAGKVTYRTDRDGNVHVPLGKVSFSEDAIKGNFQTINDVITKARPASVKGIYIQHVSLASTFGPSVTLDISSL
jgi:large subunit ribosomal protein L1